MARIPDDVGEIRAQSQVIPVVAPARSVVAHRHLPERFLQ